MDIEDFPKIANRFHKLRAAISKALIPLGIPREEAAEILIWAIGEDVKTCPFFLWPERIMSNTGIRFDPKTTTVTDVFRKVGLKWQSRKIKPIVSPLYAG